MTDRNGAGDPAAKLNALVGLGASEAADNPEEGDIKRALFDGTTVRGHFHQGEWWLSIVDVVTGLEVSSRPSKYWTDLKSQLSETEGFSEISDKIGNLPMPTADGKMRRAEAVTVRTLLRILQSVRSTKVEPLKQWLAQVGFERIQEAIDPSKALERLIDIYLNQGRTPDWIRERVDGIIARRELTDEWKARAITKDTHYSTLTRMLQKRSVGMGPAEHKRHKGLKKGDSLRNNYTEIELLLTRLGEKSTTEIARAKDAQGYEQNREAVKAGGEIAKNARLALEGLTGQPVASKSNFLPKPPATDQISN